MFFAPLTFTDILKMIWWGLTHPDTNPPASTSTLPSRSVFDLKAEADRIEEKPLLVVASADHSYREAKLNATTAIRCAPKGKKATLHEDHYPDSPPGRDFDNPDTFNLTRVRVLLVE